MGPAKRNREKLIFSAIVLASCFYLMQFTEARAQLGPKDGAELAPTDLERVKIGSLAPDFTLESLDGKRITLSEVYRNKNVILVFYRGHW